MTEIYLIRHTQAEGNRYRMMQGHWDGDVTALGQRQIEALAERFRALPLDAVYASDLYRARLTAGAAARWQGLPVVPDPRLREINVGPWEGLFFANLLHDEPEEMGRFLFTPETFQLPGAETYAQVTGRAYPALVEIARRHEGGRVAVVSHGVTILCLLSKITGLSLRDRERLPISPNTGVAKLLWDGTGFTVAYFNDASHLAGLKVPEWSRTADLRHVAFDPAADPVYYTGCYADSWLAAHGNLEGFSGQVYLNAAREHHRADPEAVLRLKNGEEDVGLIDLDTRRGAHAGYGWVTLLYLKPEYRGQGYGIQLLGRVYAHYKALGRTAVRLHVAEDNAPALRFYRREGFRELGAEQGGHGRLLLMEKKLGGPRDV